MQPIFGRRIKTDIIREHWNEVGRLVASLQTGVVPSSVMLKKLAAYRRQNQLDQALQELGRIERKPAWCRDERGAWIRERNCVMSEG